MSGHWQSTGLSAQKVTNLAIGAHLTCFVHWWIKCEIDPIANCKCVKYNCKSKYNVYVETMNIYSVICYVYIKYNLHNYDQYISNFKVKSFILWTFVNISKEQKENRSMPLLSYDIIETNNVEVIFCWPMNVQNVTKSTLAVARIQRRSVRGGENSKQDYSMMLLAKHVY